MCPGAVCPPILIVRLTHTPRLPGRLTHPGGWVKWGLDTPPLVSDQHPCHLRSQFRHRLQRLIYCCQSSHVTSITWSKLTTVSIPRRRGDDRRRERLAHPRGSREGQDASHGRSCRRQSLREHPRHPGPGVVLTQGEVSRLAAGPGLAERPAWEAVLASFRRGSR